MPKINTRVAFFERGTDRAPFYMSAAEVSAKLSAGVLEVRAQDPRRGVTAVQSSGRAVNERLLGAFSGSFGVHEVRVAPAIRSDGKLSGAGMYYDQNDLHQDLAVA